MMKLLLAVIATCALVVSPTCIKIKHQLRSNAPTIHVLISNGNTQMTSQVARDGSHRFTTDNLSNMTLAPAGSQTIQLSYDEIFPITDAGVCTEVHPVSAGGCADGVCCKISISMYTITDAIIMTARVNNRKADGNPQFWRCEQEIQVPGVTNTEPTGEEIAAEILHGEAAGELDGHCNTDGQCGTNAECRDDLCKCKEGFGRTTGEARDCFRNLNGGLCGGGDEIKCGNNAVCGEDDECECETGFGQNSGDVTNCYVNLDGHCEHNTDCGNNAWCVTNADGSSCTCVTGFGLRYGDVPVDVTNCYRYLGGGCGSDNDCGDHVACMNQQGGKKCKCESAGYEADGTVNCKNIDECIYVATCNRVKADGSPTGNNCYDNTPSYTAPWYYECDCHTDYYEVMMQGGSFTCTEKKDNDATCGGWQGGDNEECKSNRCDETDRDTWKCLPCDSTSQCLSNHWCDVTNSKVCVNNN